MNNKEAYFEEKNKRQQVNKEAFITSKVTRKLMTIVNDVSTSNNHDNHVIHHHHHNNNHDNDQHHFNNNNNNKHTPNKFRRLESILFKIIQYFDDFDTQTFVDTFIESEGVNSLKKIIEMDPIKKLHRSIISSIDICIKLTRYDNDIRVMIYNLGFITILTNLCSSCINDKIIGPAALLFSELAVITPNVFVTSSVMSLHNHSIYYGNETDYGYDHDENRIKGESTSLIPKSILFLFRAKSLEVKRAAITLCLTLWSSNPKAVDNLKEDDSRGTWLYRTLPHIFRILLNQQKDENNRVELVTLSRHESAELIVYFYADPILQTEILKYLVSLILLQTLDTPNFIKSVLEAHDQREQVQSLTNELDNDSDNTIDKILDTTVVMTCYIFRRILQLSEERISVKQTERNKESTENTNNNISLDRSMSPSKLSSPRSPKSPRTPSKSSPRSPRSQFSSTKINNSYNFAEHPKSPVSMLPSYSNLAIEEELQPVRTSKLHLAFFCLILTIIYNVNNKTWRKTDDYNILKDGVVSRLIDSLQLWLWVDSDCNFDIKKYFILFNVNVVDYGPIECIDLASSLEEIVLCDQATLFSIIELLKDDLDFKVYMKDFKRNMYEGDKQEHNKEVFFDNDDENEEGKDQPDNNSRSDSKIMHKVLKPTGYKMLMKALGLTNQVMEKHLDVTSIDETKMMKLVSTLRPAKKKNVILNSKGSPHQLDRTIISKYKKTDLEDDEDNKQASTIQSPKASPTRIAKFDPNQSLNNLQDDEEMLEKMTNIEKIMYKIQSQLEIADLYCDNQYREDADPFVTINTETNNTITNLPKTSLLRHKISLIEHEEALLPTPNLIKKKIANRNESSKMLALLCEKEFA